MKELSIYIHIPFCKRKCRYCDFLSFPVGSEPQTDGYVQSLIAEIAEESGKYQAYTVISVFIGGGTPSILKGEQLVAIMDAVKNSYKVSPDAEVTMEMNPGAVTREQLDAFWEAGINRISIGLQTADDGELERIGRIHTYEDFVKTYEDARQTGFDNINIDLMSALPGQTLVSYEKTLRKVLSLSPEHISAYSLILEEGTELHAHQDEYIFPDEETDRQMYELTERLLAKAGYHRYEISNYAKDGKECRHNKVYWERGNYVGFGLNASSMIDNVRFRNTDTMREYLISHTKCDIQVLSVKEQMEEYMFLGLRLTRGVSIGTFRKNFGVSVYEVYGQVIEEMKRERLLEEKSNYLYLSERGLDVSNYVMTKFLLD